MWEQMNTNRVTITTVNTVIRMTVAGRTAREDANYPEVERENDMQTYHHSTFRGTAASVQSVVARNLQLLQAIESVLARLDSDVALLRAVGGAFEEVFESMKERANGHAIDSEGAACAALVQASDACGRMYARAAVRHQSACEDKQLRPDDGVVEAFEEYMATLRAVHDLVEETRDWIQTHDALLEAGTGVTYESTEDLMAALRAD